jgi:hypothetical protein
VPAPQQPQVDKDKGNRPAEGHRADGKGENKGDKDSNGKKK